MNKTLQNWLNYGWLVEHRTSRQEIRDLLAIVDRDVQNAQLEELSADWRMAIAYNAALQTAVAALAAAGFRAEKAAQHYRVLQSLEHTIGLDIGIIDQLEVFRKKRNISNYDRPGAVSETEANEMLALAKHIRDAVISWFKSNKAELLNN